MCCKRYHIIFSTFPLNFKCKICVLKDVIPNFKNHILVTWPATNLLIVKMVRVWQTKSLLFCLRYDPLIVFRRQNHIIFIFIKTMTHDLLVQMAYCSSERQHNTIDKPSVWQSVTTDSRQFRQLVTLVTSFPDSQLWALTLFEFLWSLAYKVDKTNDSGA